MNLTNRQNKIIDIVRGHQPITGSKIAEQMGYSKSTIRSDLSILTHTGRLSAKPKVGYVINTGFENTFYIDHQILHTKVGSVKSQAVCVKENDSLHDAIIEIFLHDAGTIFVVDENEYLCGVVSRKDFLKSILGNADIHSVPVSVIMSRMPNIVTTTDEETIMEAAKKIISHKIDSLPVVEEFDTFRYRITGRVSKTSVANLFVKLSKN